MRLFVGAAPGSNISNAEIIAEGNGFRAALTVDAGGQSAARFNATGVGGVIDLDLTVRSAGRQVTVYAQNIPVDATIAVMGSDALRFEAHVYHRHSVAHQAIPACTLRCTPQSPPMAGPGCRECEVHSLIFKVCC